MQLSVKKEDQLVGLNEQKIDYSAYNESKATEIDKVIW